MPQRVRYLMPLQEKYHSRGGWSRATLTPEEGSFGPVDQDGEGWGLFWGGRGVPGAKYLVPSLVRQQDRPLALQEGLGQIGLSTRACVADKGGRRLRWTDEEGQGHQTLQSQASLCDPQGEGRTNQ